MESLWQRELRRRIRDISRLPEILQAPLSGDRAVSGFPEERETGEPAGSSTGTSIRSALPVALTPSVVRLLENAATAAKMTGPDSGSGDRARQAYEALRLQLLPSIREAVVSPHELDDPLGEHRHRITSRLVHQYKNRCLLLATGSCICYCRHCFRRVYTSREEGFITPAETAEVCAYLSSHPEIAEILVSGGDPLTASDSALADLLGDIRRASPDIIIRIGTRAPVFLPSRFTPELLELFRAQRPLWIIPHINHPAELAPESADALCRIRDSGISMQSQTVLLRGVNDSVPVLVRLFNRLTALGVKPGYLFQGDMAPGTSHLRVPLRKGLELYRQLRGELSGLSTPVYAVDLPGGGGKFNLLEIESGSVTETPDGWLFRRSGDGREGGEWFYPAEE
ncbi:MAG: KamA family radical SAM protein [Spirochaetaceae bacterium]|jgi:lysine 2,3-aminomutase|nr:KamA family radical SAM protein [Spirochaetaceae bacterium]